ncbi:MAG: excinuclease ABC subunit UvrC [Anaerolineae bacterium]
MSQSISPTLQARIDSLPLNPGVYLMRDGRAQVIYVGKAKNLRSRVRSYFQNAAQHTVKTRRLVSEIVDLEWIIVPTEVDALVLENTLIKRYQPRFNVMLKDDKTYPYIKIHWQDDFPKVSVTRKVWRDGAGYYGPYTSAYTVRETLDNLRRIFPYLTCNREITGNDARACLYYDIKLCAGPCIGAVDRDEYRGIMQGLADFLEGRSDEALSQLDTRMRAAARRLNYERAAMYRDQIKLAQRLIEQQQVISVNQIDQDVIGYASDDSGDETAFQVFLVRRGKLIGRESFILPHTREDDRAELLASFLSQFYDQAALPPPEVIVRTLPVDADVIAQWLTDKRRARLTEAEEAAVRLGEAESDEALQALTLAENNAIEALRTLRAVREADKSKQVLALQQIQQALALDTPPARIECYDISTLQGTNTVGSMVVFAEGTPRKSDYRRFKIRGRGSQGEPDDFASMREMLRRRFRRAVEPPSDDPGSKARPSAAAWAVLPDLVIIDGGKGQLGIAVEVLKEFDLFGEVPVVGLAKRNEELFLPGEARSVILPRDSEGLFLIQRIRDETHRTAITFHRTLREKSSLASRLDDVPGIGPKRRKALLQAFEGDVDAIKAASLDDLAAVPGMTQAAAQAVKEFLSVE